LLTIRRRFGGRPARGSGPVEITHHGANRLQKHQYLLGILRGSHAANGMTAKTINMVVSTIRGSPALFLFVSLCQPYFSRRKQSKLLL
jgi:hypothetical protein